MAHESGCRKNCGQNRSKTIFGQGDRRPLRIMRNDRFCNLSTGNWGVKGYFNRTVCFPKKGELTVVFRGPEGMSKRAVAGGTPRSGSLARSASCRRWACFSTGCLGRQRELRPFRDSESGKIAGAESESLSIAASLSPPLAGTFGRRYHSASKFAVRGTFLKCAPRRHGQPWHVGTDRT